MSEKEKYAELLALLKKEKSLAVAFSAGVDSTFLLAAAHEALGENVTAFTIRSCAFQKREADEAISFCKERGIRHVVLDADVLAVEGFAENSPERCYFCKKALFSRLCEEAAARGARCVAEGSNADDENDYRPGARAIRELGIRSPLREVGLTKKEIRALSEALGLPTFAKPSLACLATRFAYGERITKERLEAVGRAEEMIFDAGFSQARVRVHGNVARIEVPSGEAARLFESGVREKISAELHGSGFLYVAADLDGYKTGNMNKEI